MAKLRKREQLREAHDCFLKTGKECKAMIIALDFRGKRRLEEFELSVEDTAGKTVSFESKPGIKVGIRDTAGDSE